jgi:hypothetical protein
MRFFEGRILLRPYAFSKKFVSILLRFCVFFASFLYYGVYRDAICVILKRIDKNTKDILEAFCFLRVCAGRCFSRKAEEWKDDQPQQIFHRPDIRHAKAARTEKAGTGFRAGFSAGGACPSGAIRTANDAGVCKA